MSATIGETVLVLADPTTAAGRDQEIGFVAETHEDHVVVYLLAGGMHPTVRWAETRDAAAALAVEDRDLVPGSPDAPELYRYVKVCYPAQPAPAPTQPAAPETPGA